MTGWKRSTRWRSPSGSGKEKRSAFRWQDLDLDKGKLKVMISIFGSETPVELDFLQVKPV